MSATPTKPMSTDKSDLALVIVRRFMSAAGVGGRTERARLLHRDFVVSSAGGLPFSGEYLGPRGFFDLMEKMNEVLDLTPGPITVNPLGQDAITASFRVTFTARSGGKHVEMDVVEIYTLRDGLIIKLDVYYKDPSAVPTLIAG
jgi:ketosteroid isomerase-like protein